MRKTTIITFAFLFATMPLCVRAEDTDAAAPQRRLFDPLVDVIGLVEQHYVTDTETADLVTGAINGMLHELDPYSEYVPPKDVDEFHKRTSGSYEGVGIAIDIKNGYLTVISPFQDSPAFKAGVRSGDIILEVDGESTKDWSSTRAIQALTGPAGTDVTIRLLHQDGDEETVTITRGRIQVPTVRGWRRAGVTDWHYMLDNEQRIGYVRITQFNEDTAKDFTTAVETLRQQDMQALIMDLRANPGGVMSAAIGVVDRLLDHGVIVSTRGDNSPENVSRAQAAGTWPRFHLVVLIDQGSASAAEIVAGALQDHSRAVIVGQRSWGKGSVQRIIHLPDSGAALKLTTDYYYLPNGRCVHRLPNADEWGVAPDVEEEFDFDQAEQLRDLLDDLAVLPDTEPTDDEADETETDEEPTTEPIEDGYLLEADEEDPTEEPIETVTDEDAEELMQRLLELDTQLAQAVKQCHGLLRVRPSLQGLAESLTD